MRLLSDIEKKRAELEKAEAEFRMLQASLDIGFPDTNEKGFPITTLANTEALLAHYKITVRYNEMKKEPEIIIPQKQFHGDTKNNVQITWIRDLARQANLPVTDISEHLDLIANANAYHPVREWMRSITWDGVSRLQDYYDTIKSTTPQKELYMRKWALSVVAACFREDYRFGAEGVLTFLGGQAAAKTTWAGTLFPRVASVDNWVTTGCTIDPHNKDTLLIALSSVITEMGEMGTTFRKSDKESLKQFLTQKVDKLRPPYAEKVNSYSRRTVFFGTSNELLILNDTENRRFWPIADVEFPAHNLDVEQFWAEMYAMYRAVLPLCDTRSDSITSGEWGWFLSPEERSQLTVDQEDFRTISPIVEKLQHALYPADECDGANAEWLGATMICERAGIFNPNRAHANEAAEWLKTQGYTYRKNTKQYRIAFETTYNRGEVGYVHREPRATAPDLSSVRLVRTSKNR
ncbi:VapE domain-containing protein [Leptothrix discophora]|uniref:VapE family protein n=1 Tax=Leptothrix discophora TaxID=89 RepID=A0ABT9G0D8_LEPDI|nr:VapE domain-containing protein [Leptothrix discophora]MDP4299949.1 VapE family protein [Leptothrix discophora]